MKIVKKILMNQFLWDVANAEQFARRLSLYARLRSKRLQVSWNQQTETFEVRQGEESAIHVSRPNRIKEKYLASSDRLGDMLHRYLLDDITFSAGDVVVDVGANIGELSLSLFRRFDVFPVCCEPDPVEVKSLRQNLRDIPNMIFDSPLWDEVIERPFFLDNDRGDSSLFEQRQGCDSVLLRTETLDNIDGIISEKKGEFRIRLLKLEAEGAEPEILKGGKKMLHRVDFIAADLGPERGKEKLNTIPECVNFLLEKNFSISKVDAQKSIFLFEQKCQAKK